MTFISSSDPLSLGDELLYRTREGDVVRFNMETNESTILVTNRKFVSVLLQLFLPPQTVEPFKGKFHPKMKICWAFTHPLVRMGAETRYLIVPWVKWWKAGVSISSDINGYAISTGEIKKTRIHLLLLYIHSILLILSHQSCQLILYAVIFKHLSIMNFCYCGLASDLILHFSSCFDEEANSSTSCMAWGLHIQFEFFIKKLYLVHLNTSFIH